MSIRTNTLARELEEMEDQRDAVTFLLARMEQVNVERLPWTIVQRLDDGENPLTVWREHRGHTARELARLAGITQAVLARIEAGNPEPPLHAVQALARALRVDLEDLVPWRQTRRGSVPTSCVSRKYR